MWLHIKLLPLFILVWLLGVAIWALCLKMQPMIITDMYFFDPRVETLKGFTATDWTKTDNGNGLQRDCRVESDFYTFKFIQQKMLNDVNGSTIHPEGFECEAKEEAIVWATAWGTFGAFVLYFIACWVLYKAVNYFRKRKARKLSAGNM